MVNDSDLEITKSTIKDAGNGLFTRVAINKGDIITTYYGDYFKGQDVRSTSHRIKKELSEDYCLVTPVDIFSKDRPLKLYGNMNPAKSRGKGLAQFANDVYKIKDWSRHSFSKSVKKANEKYNSIFYSSYPYPLLIATRDIQPGEEIFASYGTNYWSGNKGRWWTKLTADISTPDSVKEIKDAIQDLDRLSLKRYQGVFLNITKKVPESNNDCVKWK